MSSVTVIIPYKNNLKFLFLALESVFNQTVKKSQIIIIYDDPNKSDLKFIKKFIFKKNLKKTFPIKIIVNKKNLGAGESRNIGIKNCKSKYVAFLDSDDIWHKDKLKIQLNIMSQNQLQISHTSYNIINETGKKLSLRKCKKRLSYRNILNSCDIGLSTVIIERKFLIKNKLCFPNIKTKEDYVLWLRTLQKIPFIIGINKNLTNYRKRKKSLSSNIFINLVNGYRVYKSYMKMSYIESFYRLFILSINFLKKTYLIKN